MRRGDMTLRAERHCDDAHVLGNSSCVEQGRAKALILLPVRVVLAETHKWMKLRNTLLGTIDGFRGRLGRFDSGLVSSGAQVEEGS